MGAAGWCGSVDVNAWVEAGAERGASDTIVPRCLSVQWWSSVRCNGEGPSRLVVVLDQLVECPWVDGGHEGDVVVQSGWSNRKSVYLW